MLKSINKMFFICIIFFIMYFIFRLFFSFMLFPKKINIIRGYEQNLMFNIPAVATISVDEKSILNINNKKLSENVNVDLGKPITLYSGQTGVHNAQISVMGMPVKKFKIEVLPDVTLVPCGLTVGVNIEADGVMVLGLGEVIDENNIAIEPSKSILQAGDLIFKAGDVSINCKEDLISAIENCADNEIELYFKRNDDFFTKSIKVVKSKTDSKNKIGVWVRDSTRGIGTLTYYNEDTSAFGALGHGIVDVDTGEIINVKKGSLTKAKIVSVRKGESGNPGEISGEIDNSQKLGNVTHNTPVGIFGKVDRTDFIDNESYKIGLKSEVKTGNAFILSNVEGDKIEKYDVEIEYVNHLSPDSSKSMVIEITDEDLLSKTNGIVQGMSGSPIIQNDKIIGAVTHVFVNQPSKGYGIFIENMLEVE